MKFETAGKAIDREVAKLAHFLEKKVKPSTRREAAALLRRASRQLSKMARNLERAKR